MRSRGLRIRRDAESREVRHSLLSLGEGCCVYTYSGKPFEGVCAAFGVCPIRDGSTALGQVTCADVTGCSDGRIRSTCEQVENCPGSNPTGEDYIACDPNQSHTCPASLSCNVATSSVARGTCAP